MLLASGGGSAEAGRRGQSVCGIGSASKYQVSGGLLITAKVVCLGH
ncbi:hypothetical protein HMPREF0758_2011 [Serratia odorifera DSM 4582]|uniref:Uncharacterized protein n=1 Tax=Serratia odorifera DSM 4582 TaxID=667129 RepID=D4E0X9_SEROD|nr:hypothetical protein HMPREF0758_2011 [Serratia odorifera DSM 4582]